MALYGSDRDASLVRHINRELLHNIISQEVAFYKYSLAETESNIYGESNGKKIFSSPILFNCLIKRNPQNIEETDIGHDFNRSNTFYFLRDDLVDAGFLPEVGDIIFYYGDYYEIEQAIHNQLFLGKDPAYNYGPNPLNPELERFGYSVSLGYVAHYVSAEKTGIELGR